MRDTVMASMAKSLPPPRPGPEYPQTIDLAAEVGSELQRLKWFCWHGNVVRALHTVEDLQVDLDVEEPSVAQVKLLKAIREFES